MAYIKQITNDDSIIIVNTDDFEGELITHQSIIEHPELFEIIQGEKPEKYTGLNYQSSENIIITE